MFRRTTPLPSRTGPPREATRIALLTLAATTLAGCMTTSRESSQPVPPALRLLSAGTLELPSDCEPASGQVYRTHFVVQADGAVEPATPGSSDGCVDEALRRWVSSFRYEPLQESTPAVFDWLAVTGTRG